MKRSARKRKLGGKIIVGKMIGKYEEQAIDTERTLERTIIRDGQRMISVKNLLREMNRVKENKIEGKLGAKRISQFYCALFS